MDIDYVVFESLIACYGKAGNTSGVASLISSTGFEVLRGATASLALASVAAEVSCGVLSLLCSPAHARTTSRSCDLLLPRSS